jgi:hypothetical protein
VSRPAVELPAGADPVLGYAAPDVEQLVFEAIRPLGGVITWSYTAGPGDPAGWLWTVSIQVDIRAHSRGAASARADAARRVVCALPWAAWPDGVISRVDVIEGPFWMPDQGGAPRYVARYAITAHPARVRQPTRR